MGNIAYYTSKRRRSAARARLKVFCCSPYTTYNACLYPHLDISVSSKPSISLASKRQEHPSRCSLMELIPPGFEHQSTRGRERTRHGQCGLYYQRFPFAHLSRSQRRIIKPEPLLPAKHYFIGTTYPRRCRTIPTCWPRLQGMHILSHHHAKKS